MTGVEGLHLDSALDGAGFAITDRLEERHRGFDVLQRVKGFHRSFFGVLLVDEAGVAFRDVRGVAQHGIAEIDGGGISVDWAVEAVPNEQWQVATMVDMRVRQHHRVDGARGEGKFTIDSLGFFTAALVHAAIEEDALAFGFEKVHGSGDGLGGSVKG